MMDEFWNKMEGVSQIMTDLEKEHKPWFSIEEEKKLLDYKEYFIKSCLFWNESELSESEKMDRIGWEYNNMFDKLCDIINNNVDEYDQIDKDYEIEIQDEKEDEF